MTPDTLYLRYQATGREELRLRREQMNTPAGHRALLPCPFCGTPAHLDDIPVDEGRPYTFTRTEKRAMCANLDCPVSSVLMKPETWNARAASLEQQAPVSTPATDACQILMEPDVIAVQQKSTPAGEQQAQPVAEGGLLPCPFCSGSPVCEIAPCDEVEKYPKNEVHFVVCADCEATTAAHVNDADATKAWNNRTAPAQAQPPADGWRELVAKWRGRVTRNAERRTSRKRIGYAAYSQCADELEAAFANAAKE